MECRPWRILCTLHRCALRSAGRLRCPRTLHTAPLPSALPGCGPREPGSPYSGGGRGRAGVGEEIPHRAASRSPLSPKPRGFPVPGAHRARPGSWTRGEIRQISFDKWLSSGRRAACVWGKTVRTWTVCFSCSSLDEKCTEKRSRPVCVLARFGNWMWLATGSGNNKRSPGRRAARQIGAGDADSVDMRDTRAHPPSWRTAARSDRAFGRDTGTWRRSRSCKSPPRVQNQGPTWRPRSRCWWGPCWTWQTPEWGSRSCALRWRSGRPGWLLAERSRTGSGRTAWRAATTRGHTAVRKSMSSTHRWRCITAKITKLPTKEHR